jgi:hypothetical protein
LSPIVVVTLTLRDMERIVGVYVQALLLALSSKLVVPISWLDLLNLHLLFMVVLVLSRYILRLP